jgi:hypothetical protein
MKASRITGRPAAAAAVAVGAGRRRRATARAAALAAALAAAPLLTAACSGPAGTAGSSGAGRGALAQALAFAHCMRSHGAPNYPDPNRSGVFLVNPSNHARFDAPQSTRAACQHLLPRKGEPLTPAQQEQQQAQQLAFVACMHKDGFPQLPDGWSGNVGQLISAHIDPHSPRLNAAMNKCGSW